MNLYPFSPFYGSAQQKTAGTSSASADINAQNKQVRIVNKGTSPVWVRTWASQINGVYSTSVDATTADCYIPPSTATIPQIPVILTKDQTHDKISYISTGSTSAIEIMTGEGFG